MELQKVNKSFNKTESEQRLAATIAVMQWSQSWLTKTFFEANSVTEIQGSVVRFPEIRPFSGDVFPKVASDAN